MTWLTFASVDAALSVNRPPFKKFSKGVAFFPLQIGDHVFVGEGSVVNAAQMGSYVYIGRNCVVGRRCVLKDACALLDDTVLAPETIVPPFSVFGGSPGRLVAELPECTPELMSELTRSYYEHFIPDPATVGATPGGGSGGGRRVAPATSGTTKWDVWFFHMPFYWTYLFALLFSVVNCCF